MVKLSLRNQKRVLIAWIGLQCLAIAAVLGWATQPPSMDADLDGSHSTRSGDSAPSTTKVGSLAIYEELAKRDLRKPLYDPVIAVPKPKPKPKPQFPGTLTGTVVEDGFSYATFRLQNGRDELVQLDQPIGDTGAVLKAVELSGATIQFAGESLKLEIGGGS